MQIADIPEVYCRGPEDLGRAIKVFERRVQRLNLLGELKMRRVCVSKSDRRKWKQRRSTARRMKRGFRFA